MTSRPATRRLAWGLIVTGALLAAVSAALLVRGHWARPKENDGQALAEAFFARSGPALEARARALEPKAKEAARVPELISGIDIGADANTFEDLLTTEDWWSAFRSSFAVSGLVSRQGPIAILGPAPGDLAESPIVRQAHDEGVASGLTAGRDGALLLAAARVPRGKHGAGGGVVVVLGAPLDQTALQAVMQGIVGRDPPYVALTDGKRLLAQTGPEQARTSFLELLANPPQRPTFVDSGELGAAWSLPGGLRLLALFPSPATAQAVSPRETLVAVVAGLALMLLGGFLRRAGRGTGIRDTLEGMPAAGTPTGPFAPAGPHRPSAESPAPLRLEPRPRPSIVVSAPAAPDEPAMIAARKPDNAPVPTRMGRYELLERIGEGGMAEICIAAAHGAEGFVRRFVVKRMHPHLVRNREAVNQFIDEARLQSGLVHSNIVPVYDFGKVGDEYFIALEYIHGRDLERVVRRHLELYGRALSVPVAFYIVQEVLEALAYAHTRTDTEGRLLEIVHRDVTPANVLVSFRGEVKLTDFGIAKAERRVSKTELGTLKGNASFMSPEQARGEKVDGRSDLFSAGVVLYYCITGQFLYGDDEAMLKRLLRAAGGPATSEYNQIDQVPELAAGIIRRALSFDPKDRYPSARDFARALVGHHTGGRAELADLMSELFPDERRPSP